MLNRFVAATVAVFALGSTTAMANVPDSWTDLDPRVRAAQQANAATVTVPEQVPAPRSMSKLEILDRSSPL